MKKIVLFVVFCIVITFSGVNCVSARDIVAVTAPVVSAKGYALIEATTGRVVAAQNEHTKLPMASTTKIMTALLALEQPNINEYFTVDSSAIMVEGSSMGLMQGDQVSLYALAQGMLLPSGNDAANAAAVRVSGSIPKFVEKMNKRAADLSMNNTHFETPSGLDGEQHFSTAFDMAILARVALQNPDFKGISRLSRAKVEFGNPPFTRYLSNHNRLVKDYPGCIGVKTGFTKKAGRCLVSAVERDGVTLICVTLNAADDWNVHKNLYDYGFSVVKLNRIDVDTSEIRVDIVGGEKEQICVVAHTDTYVPILVEDFALLRSEVRLNQFYYAPLTEGEVLGEIGFYLDGVEIATVALVSGERVRQKKVEKKWWQW